MVGLDCFMPSYIISVLEVLSPCILTCNLGPIYRLTTAGKSRVIVSSNALINEICDETRFAKKVAGALEVRDEEGAQRCKQD